MKKKYIVLIVVLIVISLFVIIGGSNKTFFNSYYRISDDSQIPIPLFSYYVSENDNEITFKTVKSAEATRSFITKYLNKLSSCYDESYFYDKGNNVTISKYEVEDKGSINEIYLSYKKGNYCENEFVLDDNWMIEFLNNSTITEIKADNNVTLKYDINLNIEDVKNAMNEFLSSNYTRANNKGKITDEENDFLVKIYYTLNSKSYELSIFDYEEEYIAFVVVDPNDAQKNAIYKVSNIGNFFNKILK